MSLKDKLMEDLKTSMKNKNKLKKDVVTMIRSAVKQREVDERTELNDEAIIDIIAKQVKQKKDAIEDFEKGGRQDLVELTQNEVDILLDYLPEQLSEDELRDMVKEAIDKTNASSMKDMAKIMGYLMPKIKGKADGSMVNRIAKEYL